jgi:small subunit ribosomal protein S15
MSNINKQEAIDLAKKGDKDTGSTGVQISILSAKIDRLAEHLKTNRKDKHSTRGLLQMIANRRKLVKYMKRTDAEGYEALAEKLGLKK